MWLILYIAWLSSLQSLLTNLNFDIAFLLFVCCTFFIYNRGMKEFSYGLMDERRKEFSNGPMDERRREFSNGPMDERRMGMKDD